MREFCAEFEDNDKSFTLKYIKLSSTFSCKEKLSKAADRRSPDFPDGQRTTNAGDDSGLLSCPKRNGKAGYTERLLWRHGIEGERQREWWFGYTRFYPGDAVIPFLHVGPISIPTFGLMVAVAMLAAYYVLRADMARRGLAIKESSTVEMFIVIPALAGIVGAKLYHVLETPRELLAHPADMLLSRYGLAWFGGLIGGFGAWVFVARWKKIPLLESFDAGSTAAALGYGIGRIGCLLSGDGDYGIPTSLPWGMSFPNGLVPTTQRVHPTPIYELIIACAIALVLWRLGSKQISARLAEKTFRWLRPGGVFSAYLLLTGATRFLVEFIRINPRSFFGLTNAQTASIASMIAGAFLWWRASSVRERVSATRRSPRPRSAGR